MIKIKLVLSLVIGFSSVKVWKEINESVTDTFHNISSQESNILPLDRYTEMHQLHLWFVKLLIFIYKIDQDLFCSLSS